MKTELYIENNLVELDESVQFAITSEFNNLSNPTSIINDWTKEVAIPFTNSNHKLFGHLYDINSSFYGFNPHLKFNFTLLYNGLVVMTGYMKMNSITKENGKGTYNITLNGMLGKILSDLKNIGFKNSEYPIDERKYVDSYITKELVLDTFENIPDTTLTEDLAIVAEWTEGSYYKKNTFGILSLETNPDMITATVNILPNTDYVIKGIRPSTEEFYGIILFKNGVAIKGINLVKDTYNEYTFRNESWDKMVVQSFRSFRTPLIIKKNQPSSIIGFTPTNSGYYPNFDSATFCKTDSNGNTIGTVAIEDELANSNYPTSIYSTESAVGDGILPRQLGEYRSYYQQPYMYMNKLFQMFVNKAEEVTGYTFNLDTDWFNDENPYWSKLCMLLNTLNVEESAEIGGKNSYYILTDSTDSARHYWDVNNCTETKKYSIYAHSYNELTPIYADKKWSLSYDKLLKLSADNINSKIVVNKLVTETDNDYLRLNKYAFNKIRLFFKDSAGEVVKIKKFATVSDEDINSEGTFNDAYKKQKYDELIADGYTIYTMPYKGRIEGDYKVFSAVIPLQQELSYFHYGDYFTMDVESEWTENFVVLRNEDDYNTPIYWDFGYTNWNTGYVNTKRSYSYFTLSDLWDESVSVYDIILNYTKIFGLLWTVDYANKKINIIRRINFFKEYTVEDWSDKVDYSKQFIISPIVTEHKYIKFNYSDLDTDINNAYNEEFDVNYGEIRLDTAYKFNNETSELFTSPIPPSITSSDSMISYPNMLKGNLLLYTNTEIFPDLKVGTEGTTAFGSYFFRNENQPIDRNLSGIAITDDTDLMKETGEYMYIHNASLNNVASPSSLPYLSIKNTTFEGYRTDNLCLFNTPQTAYSNETYSGKSIYYNFWKHYLDERYSNKIKKVTCYLNLNPMDYFNFKFNKFIYIDNQLYFVNKIYDYDLERQVSTKVDLLTVDDIRNFYTDNFNETILELSTNRIVVSANGTSSFYITTNRTLDGIDSPIPYTITVYEDLPEYTVYKVTIENPELQGVYVMGINVEDQHVECEVIVTDYVLPYFEYSPTSIEVLADNKEYKIPVTVNTNQPYSVYESSSKVEIIGNYLYAKSATASNQYILFRLRNGDTYRLDVTFTDNTDIEIIPTSLTMSTGQQSAVLKLTTTGGWSVHDLPTGLTFNPMDGVGGTTYIQVTSNIDTPTVIPVTFLKDNGNELTYNITIE